MNTLVQSAWSEWSKVGILYLLANVLFLFVMIAVGEYGIQPGDGAELGTVSRFFGIAHPTGYPLFISISRFFFLLFRDGQFAVALLSKLCWMLGLIIAFLPHNIKKVSIRPAISHFSFLLISMIWTSYQLNALTAEVYSFLFLIIVIILRIYENSRFHLLTSFLIGLALSHHWLAIGLIPIWIYLFFQNEKSNRMQAILSNLLTFGLGFSSYLILFFRADEFIPVSWNAISTTSQVIEHIKGSQYLSFSGWSWQSIVNSLYWLPKIYLPIGILFILLSITFVFFSIKFQKKSISISTNSFYLPFSLELTTLLLILGLTLGYTIPDREGYFLASIAVLAIWSNKSIQLLFDKISNRSFQSILVSLSLLMSVFLFFNFGVKQFQITNLKISLRETYAESILKQLPTGTLLFAGGDHTAYPLIAAELSQGEGKSVTVVSANLRKREILRLLEKFNGGRQDIPDVRFQLGLVYPSTVAIVIDPLSSQHDASHLAFRLAQARLNQPDTLQGVELIPRGLVYQLKRPNEPLIPVIEIPIAHKNPTDPLWYIVNWIETQKTGKVSETAQTLGNLLVEQHRWDLLAEFGIHLRSLQLWELAEWAYRLALQHYPHGSHDQKKLLRAIGNIYRDRANVALARRNEDVAISLYEKSLQIDPDHPQTLKTLGLMYLGKNEFDKGILSLRKYLEMQDDPLIRQLLDQGGKMRVRLPIDNPPTQNRN